MGSGFAEDFGVVFLLVFAAAFPIVNPAGSALIFLDITHHAQHLLREELARRIALYSFLVLNVSLFVGAYVLAFFGISVPALRVAGGIVVAAAGWKFLQEHEQESVTGASEEQTSGDNYLAMAFYPFTMPITTGPGTISVMIALGTSHATHDPLQHRFLFDLAALAANGVLALLVYFCFAFCGSRAANFGQYGHHDSVASFRVYPFLHWRADSLERPCGIPDAMAAALSRRSHPGVRAGSPIARPL